MNDPMTSEPLVSKARPIVRAGNGWSAVARDAFPRNPYGIVPVTLNLVRAPFQTIFRLADDPAYSNYWTLLLALAGLTIALLYVTLPYIFNMLAGQDLVTVASDGQRLRLKFQMTQFAAVIVSTPAQYYAFRAFSPITRSPRAYVKMAVLGNCYNLLIRIAFGILALVVGLVVTYAKVPMQLSTGIAIEFAAATVVNVAMAYELHRRYWQLPWWKTLALMIFFVLLASYFVSPRLSQWAEGLDHFDSLAVFGP